MVSRAACVIMGSLGLFAAGFSCATPPIELGARVGVSSVGVRYGIGDRLWLGYSYQHVSNSSLFEPNPGLDLHMLILGKGLR